MNQITHIFRKDIRHYWAEIALCQMALIARVWNEIQGWKPHEKFFGSNFWQIVILLLLPVAWWVLVVRVVQGETLVGDRQFWTTRPYEWKKLLAAKILFVLAFVNFPLFLAQLFLLAKAGFRPMPYMPGILWMQLLLVLLPVLPFMALAAVTRNIAQGLLAGLAVILFVAGMIALSTVLPESAMSSTDASDWLQGAVVVIAAVTAIGLQFKRRKTGLARMCLILGAAFMAIIFVITPYLVHGEDEYPLLPTANNVTLRAALSAVKPPPPKLAPNRNEEVEVDLPIVTSGLSAGLLAQARAVKLTIEAPNGFRWDSKWQNGGYSLLLPGQNSWTENFKLSYKLFQRMSTMPVKAKVSIAVAIFRNQDVRQVRAGEADFEIPQVGRCWIDPKYVSSIECRAPLVKPQTLLVTTESANSTCRPPDNLDEDSEAKSPSNWTAYDFTWNGDQGPAEFGLSPMESFTVYLWGRDSRRTSARVCPGTPLSISFPKLVQLTRVEFEITDLKLEEYRKEPFRFTFGGISSRRK